MIFEYLIDPIQIYNDIVPGIGEGLLCFCGFLFAVLMAISVHEFAHAYAAYKNGDDTARSFGRLTLNPAKHFDWLGAFMFAFVGFGWAKAVPVNANRFRKYRVGMATVSLAGIAANLLSAFLYAGCATGVFALLRLTYVHDTYFLYLLCYLLYVYFAVSVLLNLSFALFNILPLYPLDGFRLIETFSHSDNKFLTFLRQYSIFIILGLVLWGALFPSWDILGIYIGSVQGALSDLFYAAWAWIL